MFKPVFTFIVIMLVGAGCTRALNSQIGLPSDRPIKIRDIPTNDLVSLCEKGETTRGKRLSGPEGPHVDSCLYLGRQYATGGTFGRLDVVKNIPQSLYYFDRACDLGSEKGCKAATGVREISGTS